MGLDNLESTVIDKNLGAAPWWSKLGTPRESWALGILAALSVSLYAGSMRAYWLPMAIPDEYGYLAAAQYFLGNDWSAVSNGLPWYAFGYSFFIAVVAAGAGIENIYVSAQIANLVLVSIAPFLIAGVLRHVVSDSSSKERVVVTGLLLAYPAAVFYARMAWSETAIMIVPWAVSALLLWIGKSPVRIGRSVMTGSFLIFLYFLHARLLIPAFLAVFCFILLDWRKPRGLVSIASLFFGMTISWFLLGYVKDLLLQSLYGGSPHGAQHSLVEYLTMFLGKLSGEMFWTSAVATLSGQFTYLLIASVGVLPAGVAVAARRSLRIFDDADPAGVVVFFLLASFLASFASLALAMNPALPAHVFYGRYVEPLMLPVMALGLLACCKSASLKVFTLVFACGLVHVLIRKAWSFAEHLPQAETYWILITSLFPYRTTNWRIDPVQISQWFSVLALVVLVTALVRTWLAAIVIAMVFVGSSAELVRTFSYASSGYQLEYGSYVVARGGMPDKIVYIHPGGDPAFLRTQVKLANPSIPVRVELRQDSKKNRVESGAVETLVVENGRTNHFLCQSGSPGGVGQEACEALEDPWARALKIGFENPEDPIKYSSALFTKIYSVANSMPFVRGLLPVMTGGSASLVITGSAPSRRNIKLDVFVTPVGRAEWLGQTSGGILLEKGESRSNVRVPIPMRGYDGKPLPSGQYELHVVVSDTAGQNWLMHAYTDFHRD